MRSMLIFLALLLAAGCAGPASSRPEETPAAPRPEDELRIQGNREITAETILGEIAQDLARARELGFRKADLNDLAYEVRRLYRRQGYHFARVEEEYGPAQKVIRIEEGPRVVIGRIEITGAKAFGRQRLVDALEEKRTGLLGLGDRLFVAADVEAWAGYVAELYHNYGYPDVEVAQPEVAFSADRTGADIRLAVTEGVHRVLRRIDLDGALPGATRLQAELDRLLGTAYLPRLRREVGAMVEEFYGHRGRPDTRVRTRAKQADKGQEVGEIPVTLVLKVEPGPVVTIGEVKVEGNEKTRSSFIKGRLLLRRGDRYDLARVRDSFRRLYRTGLFKSVAVALQPSPEPGKPRPLLVKVVESPSREYFLELGFGAYDLLRGRAGVREQNMFGRGIKGRAALLGSFRGSELELGLTDPALWNSDWSADLPFTFLQRREPAFSIQEFTTGLRLTHPLGPGLEGGFAYRFSLSRLDDLERPEEEEDTSPRIAALGPFLKYDNRDDIFEPGSGTRARLFAEVGDKALGGEVSFLHGGLSVSRYLTLSSTTILAGRAETEWIEPIGDSTWIPIQERLFNGGENSVRSFKEDELGPGDGDPRGGRVRNLASLELRQKVWGNLSLALFGDYGNVALRKEDAFDDFRPGVGLGLRYSLPIGPIRLDAAWNPDRREKDGEEEYVIHFAIGMPF